jgi:hypothetical protein
MRAEGALVAKTNQSFWWLVFKAHERTVIIQPSGDIVTARMQAMLANVPGVFQEGYKLDDKMAQKVPKKMIGRVLSRKEAAALLPKLR